MIGALYFIIKLMIDHIIILFEQHEFLTAVSLVTAFYLAPILVKAVFAILGGGIAFIAKTVFNDALENKIRSIVSNLLSALLNNDSIKVNDIPLLDSDYLCIFQLYIPITENLTVYIPTVRIRVRFWRLARKTFWLYLNHLDNRLAFNGYFKLLCSEELKEINLQNANIIWECAKHNMAEECYRDINFDFSQLGLMEEKLKLYEFHLLWEHAHLKINLPGENISVENLCGHINNQSGTYEIYLHGLLDGQIISVSNLGKSLHDLRLIIPAINLTPLLWAIIGDNIPALMAFHPSSNKLMGRIVNVICCIKLRNHLEITDVEWTLHDGHCEYTGAASNHTYTLSSIEGSFRIKRMIEFTATKLNLKINNHNVGLSGSLIFSSPIKKTSSINAKEGSFSIALDSNNFTFINGLEISILDRFNLEGSFKLVNSNLYVCFHSDKEHSINALKFSYKDTCVIVDRFFGHLTIEGSICHSQDIGCYLVSASKYNSKGIYGRNPIHLQRLFYDLISQDFSIQLRAKQLDLVNFNKCLKPQKNINSFIDIEGNFSSTGNIITTISNY